MPVANSPEKQGRIRQILQTFTMTRRFDPAILWILPLAFIGTLALSLGLSQVLLKAWGYGLIMGLPFSVLVTLWLFGSRAERAAYASIAGQPGAAAAALNES